LAVLGIVVIQVLGNTFSTMYLLLAHDSCYNRFPMPYRTSLDWERGPGYSIVTNAGHSRQVIFRSSDDFDHFTLVMKRALKRSPDVNLLGFCLIPLSFTLLLHENRPGEIARFMHRLSVAYSVYFNSHYGKQGKVFRGPYKDTSLGSEDAVIAALCRIHTLSTSEGSSIETYTWSSYKHYLRQSGPWIDKAFVAHYFASESYLDELRRITQSQP